MNVFGPVPSRRLGQSLGINNIPPKYCSYACLYCQLGKTKKMQITRQDFYSPESLFLEAKGKIADVNKQQKVIDFLTFVADGEPTLDKNLGKTIELLKAFQIKIAVITNGSLIARDDVQDDLMLADWVSLKVDTADENTWRRMDRPFPRLNLKNMQRSMLDFAKRFQGCLVTETMLVKGMNDNRDSVGGVADFLAELRPAKAYILVPTRPPAENNVQKPDKEKLQDTYQIMTVRGKTSVECIVGDEGEDFYFSENLVNDLLSITAVHPVQEDMLDKLLTERNCGWDVVNNLVREGKMARYTYNNKNFFVRKN